MTTTVNVVSTAAPNNAFAWRHRSSVIAQTYPAPHYYRENPQPCAQNLFEVIHNLPPDDIVIWLDGDDWFINENVVGFVRKLYGQRDPWLTYGQFRFADGRPGWASEWPEGKSPRNVPWFATHLKTFRAGLFQQIRKEDLQQKDGSWIRYAVDLAVMFPMLEMAGRDRTEFCDVPLCEYNWRQLYETGPGSTEWNEALRVRGMPAYQRLQERPW
jgi:hypothetical protein